MIFESEPEWERQVACYCGERIVTTRRDPSKDRYVVCSRECWDRMVDRGDQEPGALIRD